MLPPSTAQSLKVRNEWAAVASIAFGTFAMVTSEFLPIGLLSPIAADLGVTEGQAGLMVTVPGLLAAIAAPAVTLAARGADRRRLLLVLTGLLVAANAVVAAAPNFTVVLIGRVLLGASVGGFWTFGVAVGRRLVNNSDGARATTVILAGISLGTVLGVPLGTLMGDLVGWRASFASVAGLAFTIFIAQALLLPRLQGSEAIALANFAVVLKQRDAIVVFIAGALVSSGHFAAYTYMEPFLTQVPRFSPGEVSWILAGYGVAGVIGTYVGERISEWDVRRGLFLVSFAMALSIVAAAVKGGSPTWAIATVIGWGGAFGAAPVCIQIWTFQAAPGKFEAASALMVTIFQISLACGAFIGGMLFDFAGPRTALAMGAVFCCLCALHILLIMGANRQQTS